MAINNIIDVIYDSLNKSVYSHSDLLQLVNTVLNKVKNKYEVDTNLLFTLVYKIYAPRFKNVQLESLPCLRSYDYLFKKIKIPEEYKKLQKHFDKLKNLPQPEQRTKEWFDYRHNRITASDTASAIDENPYEPVEAFILKKCDPDHKFLDNQNVYHGKKYEPIATLLYEHINNVQVEEFGALPSETLPFLGASPDGICTCKTLDNKFSPLLGRMLEIKCTTTRKIYTSGKIAGHICPYYYYCQVQQQLECCDLDECDFWQCKIVEYKNRNEYLFDKIENDKHTIGINSEEIKVDNIIKRGCILKFLPKVWVPEFDGDNMTWKSKFVYPSRLDMNELEYDNWIVSELENWMVKYPSIAETHYFEQIVYWKLESSHNVTINRDKNFFRKILPILKETWEQVKYYRENLDKLGELKKIIDYRKKYIKFNSKI
jgi:putative phage-type endonuclease